MTGTLTQSQQAILDGLSAVQRQAIRDCLTRYMDPNTTKALRRKGLCEGRGSMLTMDGLAIREALLRTTLLQANRNGK